MFPLASKLFGTFMKIGKFLGGKFITVIKMAGTALKVAFTANPIGLIIAAIVAVIAIFVVLYKKVEWFRDGVKKIFEGIKTYFSGVWDIIKGIFTGNFDLIKQGFQKMVDGLKKIWEGFTKILSNTWKKVKSWFGFGNDEETFEERLARAKKQAAIARAAKTGIQENWSGTNYFGGGLTTLAERGTELVEMNNSSFLVNSQTLANLPKGARILNNSQTRKSLSSRVSSLKERIKNISNSNSKTIIGGDTITINITGNSANPTDIARVVKRVIEEMQSKKRRTAIV